MRTPKTLTAEMALELAVSQDRRRTLVLHGPAACGKTRVSKKLAKFLGFERVMDDCFRDTKGQLLHGFDRVRPYGVLAICQQAHPDYDSISYAEAVKALGAGQ